MNYTPSVDGRQRKIDWTMRDDLRPITRLVAEYLDRLRRSLTEAWWSAERIAKDLGLSVSSIRSALTELSLKGLVEIVRDYSLKTRRAIRLLWRVESPAPAVEAVEPEPDEGAMNHAEPVRDVRRPSPSPAAAAPAEVDAPGERDEAARKATQEEVAGLLNDAAKVPGSTPEKAKALARVATLSVVRAAAKYAAKAGKGWAWVSVVAPAWRTEGVPDYATEARPAPAVPCGYGVLPPPDLEMLAKLAHIDLTKEY